MIIFGKIQNGVIKVQQFYLPDLKKAEGKAVTITLDKNSRTEQQLRYLFGVVYRIISDFTGFSVIEIHEVYKKKFLRYTKEYKGKIYTFSGSTSELNISEMADFINKIIIHATSELGLVIPDAN